MGSRGLACPRVAIYGNCGVLIGRGETDGGMKAPGRRL